MTNPIKPEVLLPPVVSVQRPRFASFSLLRGVPIRLELKLERNVFTGKPLNLNGVSIQVKVFSDFSDPDSLLSETKTVENQGLLVDPPKGLVEIQLGLEDLRRARPIFVAIYIEGALVDLFGNEVRESPEPRR